MAFLYGLRAAVFLVIAAIFGREILVSGAKSLLRLNFSNIDLLNGHRDSRRGHFISGSYSKGASVIVVLFALGETLEEYGVEEANLR